MCIFQMSRLVDLLPGNTLTGISGMSLFNASGRPANDWIKGMKKIPFQRKSVDVHLLNVMFG